MPRAFVLGAVLVGLVVAALVVLTSRDEEPRRPAAAAPAPLDGVAERIAPAGLGEHLTALQRIADEHGGNRAAGSAGERATADYVARRLRAAGYRVTIEEISVPGLRGRSESRLTAGSRVVREPRAAVLGQRLDRGDRARGRPRLLGRGARGAAARRGRADPARHVLVPPEGARGAARRGRGRADRRRATGARLAAAGRRPGPRAGRGRERRQGWRASASASPSMRRPRSGAPRA